MSDCSVAYTVSIVEDEAVLRDELAFQLECLGFTVEKFASAEQFYRYLAVQSQTVVVLDIGLTGEDGLSVCQHLRGHNLNIGIVFITARSLRSDRLAGLDAGADAYLVKPLDVDELALILKRLGQRFSAAAIPMPPHPAPHGQWHFTEGSTWLVAPNQARIRLSVREYQLLNALLQRLGEPCRHAELALALGLLPEEYNRHRVEVILSRLRERIYRCSGLHLPIQAERNVGYLIVPGL
ncbi:MAG: response regulator transcription factor [Candidatus Contendobacter sp.]|jgi:DNA-binding response OmpR family regulator|nr:response regulator transcription factor [Gammaproteobacteria bacterium]MCC8992627.1 response regulator transcription factor [Candidatus Contendobacter sp.]